MSNLPFAFKWVTEDQDTFDATTMAAFDEDIFSFQLKHDEGQVPTLDMVIRNPRIGLIAPTRSLWAWLAWQSPADDPIYAGALVPIFFGVVVGVPTSLFAEKITLQFIARSPQFIANKQHVAETMKVAPYYDPIWLDDAHRDDPDSILEGYSSMWHVDRLTLAITASDILEGEDGTVVFDEDHALYNSVGLTLGQPPLTNLRVEATVHWSQRTTGFVDVPQVNLSSYTGETLLSGWPKPGAGIGGGYRVESSYATDVYFVSQTPNTTFSYTWTNVDTDKEQCSNESASTSSSGPALLSPNPLSALLTGRFTTGLCSPFDDPPVNTPATTSVTGVIVPLWSVSLKMTLRYEASRQYSEIVVFDMTANTQGILASPTVAQHTETLAISSVDIGAPLVRIDAWTNFRSAAVGLTQIIFPNNPTKPGGLSHQICVQAGVAGAVEPEFSDFPGVTTVDGSVVWASMGESPLTNNPGWSPASFVPVGQIILLQNKVFNPATGDFEPVPNSTSYYLCTRAGQTNSLYSTFHYTPAITSNTEATPAIRTISVIYPPTFSAAPGAHIADGSVTWTVLGPNPPTLQIPIGGTPTDVHARQFFPTGRGQTALQYLISKARARLRLRARAVTVSWQAAFNLGVGMSCRKNATLFDPRLPGGAATGKVISYTLSASGDGTLRSAIQIGCAIGYGDSIAEITGTPVYATEGYMQKGYQIYDGEMVAHGSNDTTYSPPASQQFDDGLTFPLRWADISDGGKQSGTLAEQKTAIEAAFIVARELEYLQLWSGKQTEVGNVSTTQSGLNSTAAWKLEREQLALASGNLPYVMAANPIVWACLLKPCAGNGPFEGAYAITVSPLVVPQGINLESASSP